MARILDRTRIYLERRSGERYELSLEPDKSSAPGGRDETIIIGDDNGGTTRLCFERAEQPTSELTGLAEPEYDEPV